MTEPNKNETCVILSNFRVLPYPTNPSWRVNSSNSGGRELRAPGSLSLIKDGEEVALFPAGSWIAVMTAAPYVVREQLKTI